jgi:hypothetical protein
MKVSMPLRVCNDDEEDDDDDDKVIGEAEDLASPPISNIKDAFLGSVSNEETLTAFEGEHGAKLNSGCDNDDKSSEA